MILRLLAALVLVPLAASGALAAPARPAPAHAARPQAARATEVTLAELGYPGDVTVSGVYPTFTFNVPVTPVLRAARLRLDLHVSPLADRRSSIAVVVNGVPVFARTLRELGDDPRVTVRLPVPAPPATNLQIAVRGYLFITGDVCADLRTNELWLTVGHDSAVALATGPAPRGAPIAAFFAGYGDRIAIVDQAPPGSDGALDVVKLPYAIRQIERWHQPEIVLADRPDPHARNLIVRPGPTRYDAARDVLYVDPADVKLIDPRAAGYLLTGALAPGAGAVLGPAPAPTGNRLALSQLGVASQTATGLGELAFVLPLDANALGGIPRRLTLHLSLAHTPVLPGDGATAQILVDGALVASRTLSRDGGTEVWDAPIPQSALSSTNDVRVVVGYYTGPGACIGNLPQMTVTIGDSSYYSWGSLDRDVGGISDFLKTANGNVAVLLGDARFVPQAFHLMDALGRLDPRIAAVQVARYTGTIPPGTDYAIVAAAPDRLGALAAPLRLAEPQFRVVNPLTETTAFATTYEGGLGALETTASAQTPTLVLSYWKDPAPLGEFGRYDAAVLAQQVGNVALFGGTIATYSVGQKLRVFYATADWPERIWALARLPVAIALVLLVIALILYATRRLTGSRTAAE